MAGTGGYDRRARGLYKGSTEPPFSEVGIFFLHHTTDLVTSHHLSLIKKHNPNVPIVTVSGGDKAFPDGLMAKNLKWGDSRWFKETRGGEQRAAWMFADLMLYGAYAERKIRCKRWVVLEWDVLCTIHVANAFRTVWNADLAAASTFSREQNANWPWFVKHKNRIPEHLQKHVCAAAPFGVLLCSDRLLSHASRDVAQMPSFAVFSECRVATLCRAYGMEIKTCEKICKTVSYNPRFIKVRNVPGIYHPVKQIVA